MKPKRRRFSGLRLFHRREWVVNSLFRNPCGGLGETGAFNPANIRADPNIFDKLFEMFGVTEKTKEEPEENGN